MTDLLGRPFSFTYIHTEYSASSSPSLKFLHDLSKVYPKSPAIGAAMRALAIRATSQCGSGFVAAFLVPVDL